MVLKKCLRFYKYIFLYFFNVASKDFPKGMIFYWLAPFLKDGKKYIQSFIFITIICIMYMYKIYNGSIIEVKCGYVCGAYFRIIGAKEIVFF